jgi:hypothetical protein
MKKRNLSYFKMSKARKVFERPLSSDLSSLLNAAKELSRSNVVRRHIEESLAELKQIRMPQAHSYKLTA